MTFKMKKKEMYYLSLIKYIQIVLKFMGLGLRGQLQNFIKLFRNCQRYNQEKVIEIQWKTGQKGDKAYKTNVKMSLHETRERQIG